MVLYCHLKKWNHHHPYKYMHFKVTYMYGLNKKVSVDEIKYTMKNLILEKNRV